jgi:RHS repeat-associated protein
VFNYDLADQATGVLLNVQTPESTPTPAPNITYDSNGNRTSFHPPYVLWQTYGAANDLSGYTTRTISGVQSTAGYDHKGNLTSGFDGSAYAYDAQNRLTSAPNMTTKYDGLNRQVSRAVTGRPTVYSVWDGWDLIEEYQAGGATTATYLYGATGLIYGITNGQFTYYFQDASGSTSHVTDVNGSLLEWYRYDLQGTPVFYNASDQQISASAYGACYLFTGQQWRSELGLYDLRNRFYSPDLGRFLQPDPIGFNGDATNLYRYCENNPLMASDPSGTYAVPHPGGWYTYMVNPGWGQYVWMPTSIGPHGWCAEGAQILSGGWLGGSYHDMPNTSYWRRGAPLGSGTAPGTVVARGWLNGGYPQISPWQYLKTYGPPLYHIGIFLTVLNGQALILEQSEGVDLHVSGYSIDQLRQEGWSEVRVNQGSGPYASGTSSDPNGRGGVVVSAPPLSNNEQAKIKGWLRLASMFNPYWGYLPTTSTTNWAGGIAGPNILSPWEIDSTNSPTLSNFGDITVGMGIGAMEPGESCFVAGTPVLMADGSEKPIERIQVGETVLAWNEGTKQIFSTKVVKALHHEEKVQTLFDVELEDGRRFTVNNTHPMYVVEDGDFVFTDELAARFAKGEPVTFQDSRNQPLKIASLRMHRLVCKTYNLHVEGQGEKGHTYYANGILVHNRGVNRWK